MAFSSRYMVVPSQLTKAGAAKSKPAWRRRPCSESRAKSTGTNLTFSGTGAIRRFHSCVAGWSISNVRIWPASRDRLAKESRPAPSKTYWPIPRQMPRARLSSV